ncbi:MAG: KdsC family phosphatase [Nitrospinota bacterium]
MSVKKPGPEIVKKAKQIKIIILDVDGVLTDGGIIIDDNGVESKTFYVRDGLAIAVAVKRNMKFSIISGRYSKVVELRASELGIRDVHQNVMNKVKVFESILAKQNLTAEEAAFMGDDANDIGVLELAGLSFAPSDADETVKSKVNWVSGFGGGKGAVREMIELILTEQGKWDY